MGRKQTDPELGRYGLLVLFVMVQSPAAWSTFVSLHRLDHRKATEFLVSKVSDGLKSEDADGDCCRGIDAVKWGSEFNVNSSKACCLACKGMCSGGSGPCLCDSWARYGPPFALIQGTLGAYGTVFKDVPTEACPPIRIGSVAGVESGPEFFISQANHDEWNKA
uniref:Uncharacterized protein n=1 Tax=Salix viminalis TaxID=40686 RepID=A0A6N2NA35_SALVM